MLGRRSCAGFPARNRPVRRANRSGVRGPIVASKRGNARGAKGAQEGECEIDKFPESKSATVSPKAQPEVAKQAEDVPSRWASARSS